MPSIGVQGLSQQNSELLQRVSVQQQLLFSTSSAGRSERVFEEHQARFPTSTIRSLVRLSVGVVFAGCFLNESASLTEDSDSTNINKNNKSGPQVSDCKVVSEDKKPFDYVENLPYDDVTYQGWDWVTRLIKKHDFPIEGLEKLLLVAMEEGAYDFIEQHIGKYEWSSKFMHKFIDSALVHQQYRFIKILIETGKLSFQKSIYYPVLSPSPRCEIHPDTLLLRLFIDESRHREGKGKISKETWDFVVYLLEKGVNFVQSEAGPQEKMLYGRTTGENCLLMLFTLRSCLEDVEMLIEISNGNLGPNAITIIEKEKSYYEEGLEMYWYKEEYYLEKIQVLDGFIKKLSKQDDRIQE